MTKQIAIVGGGVMGETLLGSLLRSPDPPQKVAIAETDPDRSAELRENYGVLVCGVHEVIRDAEVVILAVKPQDIAAVIEDISGRLSDGAVVVSVAAGVRISQLESAFEQHTPVIRVMPNTPATVNKGMFVMSPGQACSEHDVDNVRQLLETAGKVEVISEEAQDAVTGVSGSGPAYVFYLAESMIAGGCAVGLDEDVARRLAVQTILGSAALLAESDAEPVELRRRVASPGGTTAAAIDVFEECRMRNIVVDGVKAAATRSAELSKL